jgi:lysophospholipase L1-like esterase
MGHGARTYVGAAVMIAAIVAVGTLFRLDASPAVAAHGPRHWVATWGASPQPATASTLSERGFRDQTVREIAFSSTTGSAVRVQFTNAFGRRPLKIGAAAIGLQSAGATLAPGTNRTLTFAGRRSVVIPAHAEVTSDSVPLAVPPLARLAVSVYLPDATGPATEHADAQQVNFVASGDHAFDRGAAAYTRKTNSWYLLDAIDLLSPDRDLGAVVTLGDSITDGVGSGIGTNARWPNELARRLAADAGPTTSVVDEGIGGNRVLNGAACCGDSALARFERDARGEAGVKDVILLEGVNDIGFSQQRGPLTAPHTAVSALQIVDGYERIIGLAHAAGLKILGATLTPFAGARYWTPAGEAKREAVNRWIRTSGAFDGVIDFASVLADPGDPARLNPIYDSGDHLHPNALGYLVMADAINLKALLSSR